MSLVMVLIRTGLLVVVVSVAVLIVSSTEMGGAHQDLGKKGLLAGAVLCGAGIVLGLMVKVVNVASTRRCPRCRKRVAHGHIYCEDHFQEALRGARDRTRY